MEWGNENELGDWDWHMCIAICKTDSKREPAVYPRELNSGICGDLDGWERGSEVPKWGYICIHIADSLCCIAEANTTLFITASEFPFTTRYIHNCVSFPFWLSLFIPSGAISPLFPSNTLDTYQPGGRGWVYRSVSHLFTFLYSSWDSQGKNAEVVCHSLL